MNDYRTSLYMLFGCKTCGIAKEILDSSGIFYDMIDCAKNVGTCEEIEKLVGSYQYPMVSASKRIYDNGVYIEHSTIFLLSSTFDDTKIKKINKKTTIVPCLSIGEMMHRYTEFINSNTLR